MTNAERAETIVREWEEDFHGSGCGLPDASLDALRRRIRDALDEAAKVPEGHIRDETGTLWRVKFTTPAGSPSPIDNSTPFRQFYCEPVQSAKEVRP